MEIPINAKDVQFLILLVNRYLRKQRHAYHRVDQQHKVAAIHARGGYDAHLSSIERAQAVLTHLEQSLNSPDELA